jgi:hypothetical protein
MSESYLRSQRIRFKIVLFVSIFLMSACGLGISEEERNEVFSLIEWNLYYARTEDLNGYMWTIHPDSPVYSETEPQMAMLFREYDLAYSIEEWEIISINSQSARVRVVQTTRRVSGAEPFRDNLVEAIHTLRKDAEGEWKIYSTEIREDSLEFLD